MLLQKFSERPLIIRVVIVALGYAGASLAAFAALYVFAMLTAGPDRDASSGMYALSDSAVFLFTFFILSAVPTFLLLHLLKPFPNFWTVLAIACLAVSLTGLLGALHVALRIGLWGNIALPRLFLSPFILPLLLLAALVTPFSTAKRTIAIAAVFEFTAIGISVIFWLLPVLAK